MKKILLTEVDRINELMGNNKLLNEQWIPALVKSFSRFIDDATKKGWNIGKAIEPELEALAKAASDEEAVKILSTISNKSKEFADKILPVVMNSLSQNVKTQIENILNFAKKEMDSGKSMSEVSDIINKQVDNTIVTEFKGVKDLIKQQIKDDISSYRPNVNPLVNTGDKTLRTKLNDAFKEWEKIVPGELTTKDRVLLTDDFWFRSARARFNQLFNAAFKKEEESLKRITELLKKGVDNLDNAKQRNVLYKSIDMEIENLRKDDAFNKDLAYDLLQEELSKKIGYKASKFVDDLRKNQSLSDEYPSWMYSFLNDSYVGKMRKFPKNPDGSRNWAKYISNFMERTLMTLLTGNPRKLNEISQEFIYAYGKSALKGFGKYYLWMQIVHRTVFPVLLGLVDWAWYGWKNEGKGEDYGEFLSTWGHFIKERFKDTFIAYDKVFEESSGMDKYELNILKSILKTINPWELLFIDLKNFADWHTEGGARRAWQQFVDNNEKLIQSNEELKKLRDRYEQTLKKSDSLVKSVDSLQNKIKNLGSEKTSQEYEKIMSDFKKFLEELGYEQSQIDQAKETEETIGGKQIKIYKSSDGFCYIYNGTDFEEVPCLQKP